MALIVIALLAVVPLAGGACGDSEPGSIPLESPTSYDLGGMSEAERGQMLADLSRTSRATVYYPGDPSLGMEMAHIDKDFLSGTGPYALVMHNSRETPERYMMVSVYTPEQFNKESGRLGSGASPTVTLIGGWGDAIYELGGGGLPQTTLVAHRPGAVVVVSGNPDMTVSELTEVAAALRPVEE